MSRLLDLQDKMRDTGDAIARFERMSAGEPNSLAAAAMLKSFEKRRRQLQAEMASLATQLGVDVCRYRIFTDVTHAAVAILPVCSVLSRFQSLYSIVYDAIKTGAKKRLPRLTPDIVSQSTFMFGHTFAGSLGVAMTIEDERLTLFGSALDESMKSIFSLATSQTSDDILTRGKAIGVPAIRALHRWAVSHVESSHGVEIEWSGGSEPMTTILLQLSDLRTLISAIDSTTEVIEEEIELTAKLAGADVARRTFHLEVEGAEDIRGRFAASIPEDRTFEVGRTYRVTLRKKVRVYYSTEQEEDVSHELVLAASV